MAAASSSGRDGLLYISTGDGGGNADKLRHAQDTGSLLGKLLRIRGGRRRRLFDPRG